MEKIKVIICEPNKMARVELIDNTIESMRKIVGGSAEPLFLDDDTTIVCNEDGLDIPMWLELKTLEFDDVGVINNGQKSSNAKRLTPDEKRVFMANRPMREDNYNTERILFGTFIICGADYEGYYSLSDAQIDKYLEEYKNPYRFTAEDSHILCEEIFD